MTSRAGRWCSVFLGAAAVSAPAHAGSYLRSGDELSYSTSFGYSWATRQWNESRDLEPTSCRREYTYNSHFVEYGYSYYYTLFGGALLANARCDADARSGVGDLRLGVRGRTDVYRNHRAWELIATIPTERGDTSPRLDCGAHGLRAAVARKDDLLPSLSLGSGLGVQLWESPLAHEMSASVSLSGPLRAEWLRVGRLRWGLDLDGNVPLEGSGGVGADISDCGTRGKRIKAGVSLGASVAKATSVHCGYARAVWGEDATQSQGFSCGLSRSWQ